MTEEILLLASLTEVERDQAIAAVAQGGATLFLLIPNCGGHYAIPVGMKTHNELKELRDEKSGTYDGRVFEYLKEFELTPGPNEIINSKDFALDLLAKNIYRNHLFRTKDGRNASHWVFRIKSVKNGLRYGHGIPGITDFTQLAVRFHDVGQGSKSVQGSRQSDLNYLIGLYLDETKNAGGLAGFKRFMIENHEAEITPGDRIKWPIPGANPGNVAINTVRNSLSKIKGKRKN